MSLGFAEQQRLQQAYGLLQRGDTRAARAIVLTLLARARGPASHLLGLIERQDGDLGKARDALAEAVRLDPANAELRNTFGNVLTDLGDKETALAEFGAAIRHQPSYAPAWINRGRLLSQLGRHDEAVAQLERACQLAPRSALAHMTLGNALRAADRPEESVAALNRAIALDPARADRRLHLALSLRALGKPAEALAEVDAARKAGAGGTDHLELRAGCLMETGDAEGARHELERLLDAEPAHAGALQTLTRLMIEHQLEGDPFARYRLLLTKDPNVPAIWEHLANSAFSFRRFDYAKEVSEEALRRFGERPMLRLAHAASLSEAEQLEEAEESFRTLKADASEDVAVLNAYARHSLRMRNFGEAEAAAGAATDRAPDDQYAWALRGIAWRVLGDAREEWLNDYERFVLHVEAVPPGFGGDGDAFASAAAPVLRSLHHGGTHPPDQTLRQGTQTVGALFSRSEPEVRAIRDAVLAAYERFLPTLPQDPGHPLLRRKSRSVRFKGSWSVRLHSQGHHVSHVHPDGWFSSAFHFVVPPASADENDLAGRLTLGEPPAELGLALPHRRVIRPKPGWLVLFPSYMWHGTVPFVGEERLTCAFDLVPTD